MSDLTELMELRPLVSELRHEVEQLRRKCARLTQERDAERAINGQLRSQMAAMRDSHHDNDTPAMGNDPKATTAITRRNREHG